MSAQEFYVNRLYAGQSSGLPSASASTVFLSSKAANSAQNYFQVKQNGEIALGGGTFEPDLFIFRNAVNQVTFSTTSQGSADATVNIGRVAGMPKVSSGTVAPSSTPSALGDIYVDTAADIAYIASGTASSADWTRATPTVLTGTASPSSTPAATGIIFVDTTAKEVYVSAGTSATTDWVRVGGATTSVTGACSGALTSTVTLKFTKTSPTVVSLEIPQNLGTTSAATLTLPSAPAGFRPATNTSYAVGPGRDNAVDNIVRISVSTAGAIVVGVGGAGTAFTTTANGGTYQSAITYSLV